MMNTPRSRKGSALLIVIGMLSFLIVSAVGFAAYMRFSRLPSSYLRSSGSSRLLAKAAVAEAVRELDSAVNDNFHPGVGDWYVPYKAGDDGLTPDAPQRNSSRTFNRWINRVLVGTNEQSLVTTYRNATKTENYDETAVPPLCLEALAYIPPPLVNAARFYSRIVPTARWRQFGFDAGRHSYLVLDVSDYFDVNRMIADAAPRSSAANNRVSLSYIFENDSHTAAAGAAAAQWDDFMEQYRTFDKTKLKVDFSGKEPLVSVADFNLALGSQGGVGDFKSPFYEYVTGGGSGDGFYGTSSLADEDRIRRMTFVADGLYPESTETAANTPSSSGGKNGKNNAATILPLADPANQPFPASNLDTAQGRIPTLSDTIGGKTLNGGLQGDWGRRLSGVGAAALFDYLDTDHVPVSLAIPTTERVPMICGVSPRFPAAKFGVVKTYDPQGDGDDDVNVQSGDDATRVVRKTVLYKIDNQQFIPGFVGGNVKAAVVFPFNHDDQDDGTFSLDGRFAMFLTSGDMGLRTGSADDALHLDSRNIVDTGLADSGVMGVKLEERGISKFTNVKTPEEAVAVIDNIRLAEGQKIGTALAEDGHAFLRIVYEWTQTPRNQTGGVLSNKSWTPTFKELDKTDAGNIVEISCGLKPLNADGTVDEDFKPDNLKSVVCGGGKTLRLNAAVWLRVRDDEQKTVDLVPACLLDDFHQNNVPDARSSFSNLKACFGDQYPVLRFDTDVSFNYSIAGLDALAAGAQEVKISPETALVADPRFNHAPESWFAHSGSLDKNAWLNNNNLKESNRDGDIFMATSDAGYMQSVWELAMLPRFTNLENYGDDQYSGNLASPSSGSYKEIPKDFGSCLNHDRMWLSYDPFGDNEDAFADLPWSSEGSGFKVNPYSDSTNVLMAAFANTPIDWKRATTNDTLYTSLTAERFNEQYAFNAYSQKRQTKVPWGFLNAVAGRFMSLVRDKAGDGEDWVEAWQDMGWYYDKDKFCEIRLDDFTEMCDLWTVDRKFLYGYWRDCFAARQQLYLVFVRAEPSMMGGGAKNLPPQLGAKAMAVVWRSPDVPKRNGSEYTPHKTRILFYRQFD